MKKKGKRGKGRGKEKREGERKGKREREGERKKGEGKEKGKRKGGSGNEKRRKKRKICKTFQVCPLIAFASSQKKPKFNKKVKQYQTCFKKISGGTGP